MLKYSNGKIYTIRCRNDDSLIYVGSTIQSLAKRWGGHKKTSSRHPNMLIYQTINNDWENWYIELYETYPCNSREELCKREGEIIRLIGNLNKKVEGRTHKEYYIDNVEKIAKQQKQYYIDNIDKIAKKNKLYRIDNADKVVKYRKQYYMDNKEKYKQYRIDNDEKIKQYRIDNAEKVVKYRKQYCINNIEKLKENARQPFECECGSTCRYDKKSRHFKSKKHIDYLQYQENKNNII